MEQSNNCFKFNISTFWFAKIVGKTHRFNTKWRGYCRHYIFSNFHCLGYRIHKTNKIQKMVKNNIRNILLSFNNIADIIYIYECKHQRRWLFQRNFNI